MKNVENELSGYEFCMTRIRSVHCMSLLCNLSHGIIKLPRYRCHSIYQIVSLNHYELDCLSHIVLLRIQLLAVDPRLLDVEMAILDPLLVEVLLLLQVRYLDELLLHYVRGLLILADHVLLISLKLLNLICHSQYLLVQILDLGFQLQIAFTLIGKIVMHVIVDPVYIVFIVQQVIDLCRLLHPRC